MSTFEKFIPYIAAAGLTLNACGKEAAEEETCSEPTTSFFNAGRITGASGDIQRDVLYKVRELPDCYEATIENPFYIGAKGMASTTVTTTVWDPNIGEVESTPRAKPSIYYSAVERLNIAEGGSDTFSFGVPTGAFPDLNNEDHVQSVVLNNVRLCLLTDNPGEPSDVDYPETFEALNLGCTTLQVLNSDATSSETGEEVMTDAEEEPATDDNYVPPTGEEVDSL